MAVDVVPSRGFQPDIEAVNGGRVVALHRFPDGALLVLGYDGEIPTDDDRLAASGYVFRVAEADPGGRLAFGGRAYAAVDIYDYVLWTDDAAVEAAYHEVLANARAEGGGAV